MKKLLVIIVNVICLSQMMAQSTFRFHSGFNIANARLSGISDQLLPNTSSITEFTAGLGYGYKFTEQLSLRTELNYMTKGFRANKGFQFDAFGVPIPLGITVTTGLRTLEVPLLVNYEFTTGTIIPYAFVGPSVSYATSGFIQETANFLIDFNIGRQQINLSNNNFNRWEAGGKIGAGIKFQTPLGGFFVEGQYYHSLTDFFRRPIVDVHALPYQVGFQAGFAYSF